MEDHYRQFEWDMHRTWAMKKYVNPNLAYDFELYLMPLNEYDSCNYKIHYIRHILAKIFGKTNKKMELKISVQGRTQLKKVCDNFSHEDALLSVITSMSIFPDIFGHTVKPIHFEVKEVA